MDRATRICAFARINCWPPISPPPIRMHLHKNLPIGAGLGGGSADAAFALRLINDLFRLKIPVARLENYAARLGSDCPFFIQNKAVRATGRGDVFESAKVDLKGYQLVIVKPRAHVSTAEAYSGITPKADRESLRVLVRETGGAVAGGTRE